jgi:2-hydroxy-6-oxonona-2,4-dienedioate hydrolase
MGGSGYRRNLGASRERVLAGSWIISTRLGPVEYATLGEGAPVLVLEDASAARGLALEGFRVIIPARPGCLDPGASPRAQADTWAALLDALRIRRIPVVASGAGAAAALQLAVAHPGRISAFALTVPGNGSQASPPVEPSWVDFPVWVLMKAAPRIMYGLVGVPASLVASLPREDWADLEESVTSVLPAGERITVPTLLVSAADDLYRTLPVVRQLDGLVPASGPLSFGRHILLGRGHEVWPAVGNFIRLLEA